MENVLLGVMVMGLALQVFGVVRKDYFLSQIGMIEVFVAFVVMQIIK